jgi:hypothetical protein
MGRERGGWSFRQVWCRLDAEVSVPEGGAVRLDADLVIAVSGPGLGLGPAVESSWGESTFAD